VESNFLITFYCNKGGTVRSIRPDRWQNVIFSSLGYRPDQHHPFLHHDLLPAQQWDSIIL